MGTPAYMSPEQILGDAVDARSDVYGLACVVYEMLTGHPPFPAVTARAVFTRHHLDVPDPIRGERPDVPEHVEKALLTALAKQPGDRFASTSELLEAMRRPGTDPSPTVPSVVSSKRDSVWLNALRSAWLVVPTAATLLIAGGFFLAYKTGHLGGGAAAGTSVAVLPIRDLGGDTTQAYLSEGLTDELSSDLAQIKGLRVINRSTMRIYGKSGKSPTAIGHELGVAGVVSGTMQRFGDTLQVSAQLSSARNPQTLWAQSYRGSNADLLRFQRDIAAEVSAKLLGGNPSVPAVQVRTGDPKAIDAYIRGRYWWNKRGQANLLRAIQFFSQALDADPTFARAYSGTADAYVQLGYASYLAPSDAFPKAEAAARKALELDSTLAEPHATLGFVKMYYAWDWPQADREFRIAIARNPSYATAHEWYGLFLSAMGRYDEAIAQERSAQTLDPLSVGVASTTGWVMHYSGRQGDAETALRTAIRMDSGFALAHLYLGRVLQANGQLQDAVAQYQAGGSLRSWVPSIAGLGNLYALRGSRDQAIDELRRLDSLRKTQYVTSYAVALIYTALAQRDSAFVWLDRAVQERTHWLVWLNRDLRWKPLRGDPRFASLVHRVGLPP